MKACGKGVVSTVYGVRGLFCSESCAECFRSDRNLGLIYCAYKDEDTGRVYNPEEASIHFEHCCYCTTFLGEDNEKN